MEPAITEVDAATIRVVAGAEARAGDVGEIQDADGETLEADLIAPELLKDQGQTLRLLPAEADQDLGVLHEIKRGLTV